MKSIGLALGLLLLLSVLSLFAQDGLAPGVSQVDWDGLQVQLTAVLDSNFVLTEIINVDSSIRNRSVADGAISNPYGTLSGCLVFTGREQNDTSAVLHGVVGISKNGSIVWQSGPVINASSCVANLISTCRDLNNDGLVDIVTSWFEGPTGNVERLWVFSWNGQDGNLINAVDDQNESNLISVSMSFKYLDVNGDGSFEIFGEWYPAPSDEQPQRIMYSWNGTLFGNWADSPRPLSSGFYPRDRIHPRLESSVELINGRFAYRYKLASLVSSLQAINSLILLAMT